MLFIPVDERVNTGHCIGVGNISRDRVSTNQNNASLRKSDTPNRQEE
jgi:hypothetical protein